MSDLTCSLINMKLIMYHTQEISVDNYCSSKPGKIIQETAHGHLDNFTSNPFVVVALVRVNLHEVTLALLGDLVYSELCHAKTSPQVVYCVY